MQRIAVDGGSGLPGPKLEHQHGTQIASFAGAVMGNDWGTVGAWPGVRILSVRAMRYDATGFVSSDWRQGIAECRSLAETWPIAAINLSLGAAQTVSEIERARLEDYVTAAHYSGMSVLAAAGNRSRNEFDAPANVAGVVPVAAGNTSDAGLCAYASYAAGALIGPGCGLDTDVGGLPAMSDGGGSSSAAVFASTAVALLRSLYLRKFGAEATWIDVESWLRGIGTATGRSQINVEAAARLAGLGDVVDRAKARMTASRAESPEMATEESAVAGTMSPANSESAPALPIAPPPLLDNLGAPANALPLRLPKPVASATWRKATLTTRTTRPEFAGRVRNT